MKKIISDYSVKSQSLGLKDLDLDKREVAMYLAKFDSIDSDNDMFIKGAFAKSISEHGVSSNSNRKIAFLRYHNWQHQIGKFTKLEEDNKGLFAVAQLGTSTKGEDALRDYDEGIIKEHSVGFQYLSDGIKWIDDSSKENDGYFQIKEVKLFEGSAVTFGANLETNVLAVAKSENKQYIIENLIKEQSLVTKALINGRGSDERLLDLEMKLKYLNARLVDLATINFADAKVKEIKQINNSQEFDWHKLMNSL